MDILYYFLCVYLVSIPLCYLITMHILKEGEYEDWLYSNHTLANIVSYFPVCNTAIFLYGVYVIIKQNIKLWIIMRVVNKIARKHGYKNIKDMADNIKNHEQ